jgi:hypothetical protein
MEVAVAAGANVVRHDIPSNGERSRRSLSGRLAIRPFLILSPRSWTAPAAREYITDRRTDAGDYLQDRLQCP